MASLLEHTEEYRVAPFPIIPGYEILEELGRGGMGVVYKARQYSPSRRVAVKVLLPELCGLPEKMARFRTEANAVARLQHPNIVQIFEVGQVDGLPFFSLELVEGGSLADQLGKPWPALEAVGLVEQLSRAIHYAHERGIVHRDLKPANILLVSSESSRHSPSTTHYSLLTTHQPKITDFGLAKLLDEETVNGTQAWRTQMGVVLGTPPYMAPEQAAGRTGEIGPATDVHALGMILYEMLTGRPPFRASSVLETLEQVKTQTPVPPTHLLPKKDPRLDAICLKCLEKDPRQRYASAATLADDLGRYRSSLSTASHRRNAKRPTVVALQTILAIISTLGSAITVWQVFQAEHGKQTTEVQSTPNAKESSVDASSAIPQTGNRKTSLSPDHPTPTAPLPTAWATLNRALGCLDQGDISQGMLWLARSLQEAPPENQPLQHLVRANLTGWRTQLHALRGVFPHPGSVEVVGFSADGNLAFTMCQVRSSAVDQHSELRF